MRRFNLRKRSRINYYEPEEPNLDEYIFCDGCGDYVFEYCSVHGPLLVIPDNKVLDDFLPPVPRAALTVPHVFLHIGPSIIPGAGLGVFTTRTLPRGVRFGPYSGENTNKIDSMYCWQIYDSNNRPSHVVNAADPDRSNWMRYVNCSRHWCEQNLVAYQYKGELYYRTIRIIPRFTELLVFYGSEFARTLGVDLKLYNTPLEHPQKFGAATLQKEVRSNNNEEKEENETVNETEENNNCIDDAMQNTFMASECATNYNKEEKALNNYNSKKVDKEITKDKTVVICNECYDQFDSKILLIEHLKAHINHTIINEVTKNENILKDPVTKKYPCPYCNAQYTRTNGIKAHLLKHTDGNNKFACMICSKQLYCKETLKNHLIVHTGEQKYQCSLCYKKFPTNHNLSNHLRRSHKNGSSALTGQNKLSATRQKQEFICQVCNKKFDDSWHLKRHLNSHANEKTCQVCGKKFASSLNLKLHFNTHAIVEPCQVCGKQFRTTWDLKRHGLIHTDEKLFLCPLCPRRFHRNSSLKTHLSAHERGNTFYCCVCPLTFRCQDILNTHLQTHSVSIDFQL